MAIQVDPALQAMPQRLQDEFRREVAGTRRGPISDAVLPLNRALIDRQRRIDALTAEVARLKAENAAQREELDRTWHVLKDFGAHPGRTDDRLADCVRASLTPKA